jgi:UDP-N-acetyl-D-glucosamine dehydrogenase
MRIAVVGMGKIGLPLAVQFAKKGHSVIGTDINPKTIDQINAGVEPFPGEANLADYLQEVVISGNLIALQDTVKAISVSEVVVVAVPLFINHNYEPDFEIIDSVADNISKGLKPGTLVSFETTLPIGTTRNRLTPLLEKGSGLKAGIDFYVVFSPERVLTGRVFSDLKKYPKLVGGVDENSERHGINFYAKVLDFEERFDLPQPNGVWGLGSAEATEFAKLAETTYRDVNIALANQFALYAEKNRIDFNKVRLSCNSQPYCHIHFPGIAVGGHCIPVYPNLYLWNDPSATVVRAAREANMKMPNEVVQRIEEQIGPLLNLKVAVLGASYRGGVKETAYSGVYPTVESLKARGAKVFVHDPLYSDSELNDMGFNIYHKGDPAEVVIIQADHLEYSGWGSHDVPGIKCILDGRNIISDANWISGCKVLKIGKSNH